MRHDLQRRGDQRAQPDGPLPRVRLEARELREGSVAGERVEDLQLGDQRARGDEVVGNVGAVGREIGGRAGGGDELAEARLAVGEVVAERSDADRERRLREAHRATVLGSEAAAFEPFRGAHHLAAQRRPALQLEDVDAHAGALERARRGARRDSAGSLRAAEQPVEPGELEHPLHRLGGIRDREDAADLPELLVEPEEHAQPDRADERHAAEVEPDAVGAVADRVLERAREMIRPVGVEAPRDAHLEHVPRPPGRDLHRRYPPITLLALATSDAGTVSPTARAASRLTRSFSTRSGWKGIAAGRSPCMMRAASNAASRPPSK